MVSIAFPRLVFVGPLLGLAAAVLATSPHAQNRSLLIANVTVLDGRGHAPVPHASVIVRDGRIAAVSSRALAGGADAQTIDGRGGYLLPGFIDMHAHLLEPTCAQAAQESAFDRRTSEEMMSALLDFGITTVRSPATPTAEGLKFRDDLNAGRVRGPRAFASAELINDPRLTDAQLRRVIQDALPYRPDYFKVYAQLPPASVATVIDEAHKHGVPVIGHLGATAWAEGAQLGIDYLTHAADWSPLTLREPARVAYGDAVRARGPIRARIDWLELLDVSSPEVTETIAAIKQHRISIDPTLVAFDTKFAAPDGGRYRDDKYVGIVPMLLSNWRECSTLTRDWTSDDYRRWNAAYPKLQEFVRALHAAGIPLTTGTDLTNPWVIPGESLHQEFELLVAAGFSPREVLKMTGENAAASLRRDDLGVIEPEARADLVLLSDNPLERIGNTRSIQWVMQGGVIVSKRAR